MNLTDIPLLGLAALLIPGILIAVCFAMILSGKQPPVKHGIGRKPQVCQDETIRTK